jgi:hypothetical protein
MKLRRLPILATLIVAPIVSRGQSEIGPSIEETEPALPSQSPIEDAASSALPMLPERGAAEPGTRGNAGTVPPGELTDVPTGELSSELIEVEAPVELPGIGKPNWNVAAIGTLSSAYDDNIYISRDAEPDFIQSVSAAIYAGWGDFRAHLLRPEAGIESRFDRPASSRSYLYGGYAPRFSWFVDHSEENNLTHDALVRGGTTFSKVRISFEVRIRTLSEPDIDIGTRTDRTITSGVINVEYSFSPKTRIDAALVAEGRDFEAGLDSIESSLTAFLDYQILPKTNVAAGAAFGYLAPDGESDQTYQQLLVRTTYQPVERVYLSGAAGCEFRQFVDSGDNEVNPVFNVAARYEPSPTQQFIVEASRRNTVSVSERGENIRLTNVGLRYRQKFFQRIYATVYAGYQNADYRAIGGGSGERRSEDYVRAGLGLAAEITPWMIAQLGYEHQRNFSSLDVRDFTRNLTELKIHLHF